MEILLAIVVLLVGLISYLFWQNRKLNRQAIFLSNYFSKKEWEFMEFTIDMYIKYAKELNISSKEQHEYIVQQLEEIRKKILKKINP